MRYHPIVVKLIGYRAGPEMSRNRRSPQAPEFSGSALIGYCCQSEEQLCVVYDLNPLDSLHNHVLKDNFTWQQRIKVIMGLACLLDSIRAKDPPNLPYLVRNIDAQHIMLDQDCNPKLCDFSIISGGIFPDWRSFIMGACGYIGLLYIPRAVGFLLLFSPHRCTTASTITGSSVLRNPIYTPAPCAGQTDFRPIQDARKEELPTSILVFNGLKIAKLAMRCIGYRPDDLPTMKEVVRSLFNLLVVHRYADILDVHQMRHTNSAH
ncbi:hypothetical protein LguiB_002352 [Lonicera macranthoides]